MSTTLEFKIAQKTITITNNPQAIKTLTSLKIGSHLNITDDNGLHAGKISNISVSGDENSVTQTFELTPTEHTSTAHDKNRNNEVSATIYFQGEPYLVKDDVDVSAYISQARFKFKGATVDNSSQVVDIHILSANDITADFFINKPVTNQ